ncbi:MAG: DUF3500 domain-containing protein [Dehalococcoidia bacterium]
MATNHDHDHGHPHSQVTAHMAEAASKWLDSLSAEQKAKGTFHYLDGERMLWYYPPLNRHGLPLRDMNARQRELALQIMATTLPAQSYQQALDIIDHELILGPLEVEEDAVTFVRDPELYYWTVFGEPGGSDPWGWRVEGHHISIHFSIWGNQVIAMTPFFYGANPAEVRKGDKNGLRILGHREDLAIELGGSLDAGQRAKAIIHDKAPWDIISYNATRMPIHDEEGLEGVQMSGTQKEILMSLIAEYVNQVHPDLAREKLESIRKEGLDHFRLVWAGATDRSRDHYYRIHGGDFVVEFDNIQNGANHIHSVWRDVQNDFAIDVLSEHRLMYHVL